MKLVRAIATGLRVRKSGTKKFITVTDKTTFTVKEYSSTDWEVEIPTKTTFYTYAEAFIDNDFEMEQWNNLESAIEWVDLINNESLKDVIVKVEVTKKSFTKQELKQIEKAQIEMDKN